MHDVFLDTYFENGSPLRWEEISDGVIRLDMLHDHERFAPNQQFTHWNFRAHVPPAQTGGRVTFRIAHIDNCWNGRREPALGRHPLAVAVSGAGRDWSTVPGTNLQDPEYVAEFTVDLDTPCTQIARNVPYTDSDLQALLRRVRWHPAVRIYNFGATVEGRPLEMVEIGNPAANQILLRGRAHPWESGGNWFLEGLADFLTSDSPAAALCRDEVCFCLMPMAAKDGVYRGMTRFNLNGVDLNRNWSAAAPADPVLAPENACLQNWLSERLRQGRLPRLAICLHNDANGKLHLSHPERDFDGYVQRMARFEKLLRELTWFTEGSTDPSGFRNAGTFGEGVMEMYGIDGLVYELNAEWAAGIGRPPLHTDWKQLGADFAEVVRRYFAETCPPE